MLSAWTRPRTQGAEGSLHPSAHSDMRLPLPAASQKHDALQCHSMPRPPTGQDIFSAHRGREGRSTRGARNGRTQECAGTWALPPPLLGTPDFLPSNQQSGQQPHWKRTAWFKGSAVIAEAESSR